MEITDEKFVNRYNMHNDHRKKVMMTTLGAYHYSIIKELLLCNDDALYEHAKNACNLLVTKYLNAMNQYINETYFVDKEN